VAALRGDLEKRLSDPELVADLVHQVLELITSGLLCGNHRPAALLSGQRWLIRARASTDQTSFWCWVFSYLQAIVPTWRQGISDRMSASTSSSESWCWRRGVLELHRRWLWSSPSTSQQVGKQFRFPPAIWRL
jgi:hypothetical protein